MIIYAHAIKSVMLLANGCTSNHQFSN